MEVVTIQSEVYQKILELINAISTSKNEKVKESKDVWLDNQEFMQYMKISKRLAQHYRDSGVITFSQVGHKIYYRLADIEELLHKKSIKAHNKK